MDCMPPHRTATPLLLLAVLATVNARESHLVSHALRSRRTGWVAANPEIHRQLSNNPSAAEQTTFVEQTTLSTRRRRRLLNLSPPEQTVAALAILLAASLATGTAPSMLSGVVAAGVIAPLAYAFDSATAQNASGKRRLEQALGEAKDELVPENADGLCQQAGSLLLEASADVTKADRKKMLSAPGGSFVRLLNRTSDVWSFAIDGDGNAGFLPADFLLRLSCRSLPGTVYEPRSTLGFVGLGNLWGRGHHPSRV